MEAPLCSSQTTSPATTCMLTWPAFCTASYAKVGMRIVAMAPDALPAAACVCPWQRRRSPVPVRLSAAARTKTYFHLLLHRRLDELLAVVQPQQRVVLALDGPAPLAKLLEQR